MGGTMGGQGPGSQASGRSGMRALPVIMTTSPALFAAFCVTISKSHAPATGSRSPTTAAPRRSPASSATLSGAKPQIGGNDVTLAEAVAAAAGKPHRASHACRSSAASAPTSRACAPSWTLADRTGGVVDHALERRPIPQFPRAADGRLGHVDAHRGPQPRRPVRHRRLRPARAAPPLLRARRHQRTVDVFRRAAEAHRRFPRRRARHSPPPQARASARSSPCPPRATASAKFSPPCARSPRASPVSRRHASAACRAQTVDDLVERCKKATYGVMVWAPPSLGFPNADLTVQPSPNSSRTSTSIRALPACRSAATKAPSQPAPSAPGSRASRCASASPTASPTTTPSATPWPACSPPRKAICCVWVASYHTRSRPPETDVPTVVLGTPGLKLARKRRQFHSQSARPASITQGLIVRCDNVVSLPLKNLGRSQPAAAPPTFSPPSKPPCERPPYET